MIRFLSLVLLISVSCFISCKDSKLPREQIINKWKLVRISGSDFDNMSEAERKRLIDKTTMEFTADGKYILNGIDPEPSTGKYSISEDGKKLTVTPDLTGRTEINKVNELSSTRFSFTDNLGMTVECVRD